MPVHQTAEDVWLLIVQETHIAQRVVTTAVVVRTTC